MNKIIVAVFMFLALAQAQDSSVFEVNELYVVIGEPSVNTLLEDVADNEIIVAEIVGKWIRFYSLFSVSYWVNTDSLYVVRRIPQRKTEECLRQYVFFQGILFDDEGEYTQDVAIIEADFTDGWTIAMCAGVEVEILEPSEDGLYDMTATYQGVTYRATPDEGIQLIEGP
ncbi:MAG: hypothetical protein AAF267_25470 [Deinococcota bacterium]